MSDDVEELRKRIRCVMDQAFAGSQRAMAQSLGVSAPLISRVLSGDMDPSRKLLHAISELPQINTQWLEAGKGKPIQRRPQILVDRGSLVPLAKQLLPGPLTENEDLLNPVFVAIPRAVFSESSYAVRVDDVLKAKQCESKFFAKQDLRPDDYLIIETARDKFPPFDAENCADWLIVILPRNDRLELTTNHLFAEIHPPKSKNSKNLKTGMFIKHPHKSIAREVSKLLPISQITVGFATFMFRNYP